MYPWSSFGVPCAPSGSTYAADSRVVRVRAGRLLASDLSGSDLEAELEYRDEYPESVL